MIEIWKDIDGFNDYQISNFGNVKSFKRYKDGKIRKNYLNGRGYCFTNMRKNGKYYFKLIHRLVAQAFILNPNEKPTVNHIDGIKTNNNISNLEWATYSENMQHSYDTNLNSSLGIKNSQAKLTEENVRQIRYLKFKKNMKCVEISKMFNISKRSIYDIILKKTWVHIRSNEL